MGVPLVVKDPFLLHLLIMSGIMSILAISLNMIMLTGQLSICHAAMMGIGAYTSSLIAMKLNLPFWISMPMGAFVSGLIGFVIGLLVLRITGVYFAIVTFAFGEIVVLIFLTWESLFGGPNGLINIPAPVLVNFVIASKSAYYYLILFSVLFACYVFWAIDKSYVGRAFRAIDKSGKLAESTGINLMQYKLIAFTVGNIFAGLAGALYAHYLHYIGPFFFAFTESVNVIVAVIVGGVGTLGGAILGAIFLTILPEFLRNAKEYEMIIYSIILLLVLLFMPKGLYGVLQSIKQRGVNLLYKKGKGV